MRRNVKTLATFAFFIVLLTSCSTIKPLVDSDLQLGQTQNTTSLISPIPKPGSAQDDIEKTKGITDNTPFSSAEEAYYNKYVEFAEKYGSYSLYDYYKTKDAHEKRSYLNGVCVVNLMDFNGDGIQDLFVVYSNGQMYKTVDDGFDMEVYDFPTKSTYEVEIWTYKDAELTQILHEPYVSSCYIHPNDISDFESDFWLKYYRIFITVYENETGFPIIQLYEESAEGRKYTNIYCSDGQLVRDTLTYNGDTLQMNGLAITENVWSKHVAGYNKILLCSLLADSSNSSSSLLEGYNIDYDNTLLQTERVVRYLSQEERTPIMQRFHIVEDDYISLYLQELERSNRTRLGSEFVENHYFVLYDMDQNGVPELILFEGSSGAGMHYHFYTMIKGEIKDCGYYGRAELLADGDGGLIAYFGRMGGYDIKKVALSSDTVLFADIADGQVTGDTPYPELEELGYENYKYLAFCPPFIPLALYTYSLNLSIS